MFGCSLTDWLSKVCETVLLKINPASVQPAVIFKTLWLRAFFYELFKKKDVILGYMEMKGRLIYRTEPNVMKIVRISTFKVMLKCYFSDLLKFENNDDWKLHMYTRYVDDSNTVVEELPLGARLEEGSIVVKQEVVEGDINVPGDLRTVRVLCFVIWLTLWTKW